MKTNTITILLTCIAGIGCAATAPNELVSARDAYQRASNGKAAHLAPAEVHVANLALTKAEQSFVENSDSYRTRDLAYVAERKSQLAEATASIIAEQKNQSQANRDYQKTQGSIIMETKQDLSKSEKALAKSKNQEEVSAEKLSTEKEARIEAENQAASAMAALAKLASVKDEPRGMVITLSGSVLFASGQATLLPEARTRLDQVTAVLLTSRERNLVIEGHTDSQGSDSYNMDLSQKRADAVRNYLIQSGYQADLIHANGIGEGQPIANNSDAEGRANNRRVEIVVERGLYTSAK
jgi:outer membrane protein OmpA-like peptidoglycan-associated protein